MSAQVSGYRATRNTQGHLTIHEVPIFVECTRGEMCFDAKWIATAVAKAQQAATEIVAVRSPCAGWPPAGPRSRSEASHPRRDLTSP